MKKFIAIIVTGCALLSFVGCGEAACEHEWRDATCEEPVTCNICGETAGNPVGHHWVKATCITPKTCDICDSTEGEALGHSWSDVTCTTAKTCDICGETDGEALGHTWVDATYSAPKTCSICGKTEGEALPKPTATNSVSNSSANSSGSSSTVTTVTRRCASCNKILTSSQLAYCSSHDCGEHGCPYPAKKVGSSYGSYCEFHSCRYPDCQSKPVTGNSGGYCYNHIYIWENMN